MRGWLEPISLAAFVLGLGYLVVRATGHWRGFVRRAKPAHSTGSSYPPNALVANIDAAAERHRLLFFRHIAGFAVLAMLMFIGVIFLAPL